MKKDLLTQKEHRLIAQLGKIHDDMCEDCHSQWDLQEMTSMIHSLQARIMSRTAARAYPDLYRKL